MKGVELSLDDLFTGSHLEKMVHLERLHCMSGRLEGRPNSDSIPYRLPKLKFLTLFTELPFINGERSLNLESLDFGRGEQLSAKALRFVADHLPQLKSLTLPFSREVCHLLNNLKDSRKLTHLGLEFEDIGATDFDQFFNERDTLRPEFLHFLRAFYSSRLEDLYTDAKSDGPPAALSQKTRFLFLKQCKPLRSPECAQIFFPFICPSGAVDPILPP